MTDNETLADIAREMRTYFQAKKRGNPEHRPWHKVLSDWADLLEAAANREREALVAEAEAAKDMRNRVAVRLREEFAEKCRECKAESGNAAARRKALGLAVDYSEYLVDHLPDEFAGEIYAASEILEKCEAALSAPARNCDRFADEDDAFAAWHDSLNDGDIVSVRNAFAWLFATEGGAR